MTVDFDPVDISTVAFWSQPMRERDEAFAELRTRPTLTFHPAVGVGSAPGSKGFWAVTRHADITYVSRRPAEFCNGRGIGYSDIPQEHNEPFGSFLMTDAPRHTHLRGLVQPSVHPEAGGQDRGADPAAGNTDRGRRRGRRLRRPRRRPGRCGCRSGRSRRCSAYPTSAAPSSSAAANLMVCVSGSERRPTDRRPVHRLVQCRDHPERAGLRPRRRAA